DVIILLHVEWQDKASPVLILVGQRRHSPTIALPFVVGLIGQVIEAANAAFLHDDLSNGPGDRAVIGDAEYQPLFSVEHSHRDTSKSAHCGLLVQNIAGRRKIGHGAPRRNLSDLADKSKWCHLPARRVAKTITLRLSC